MSDQLAYAEHVRDPPKGRVCPLERHIIQFVCLFDRDLGKNYCTGRHQTLRDYKVELQKCLPRVEVTRLAVHEEISLNFRFSFAVDGHPIYNEVKPEYPCSVFLGAFSI